MTTIYDIEYLVSVRVTVKRNGDKVTVQHVGVGEFDPYYPYRAAVVSGLEEDPDFVRYPEFYGDDMPVVEHIKSLGWKPILATGMEAE